MLTAATPQVRSALLFTGELLRLLDLFERHSIAAVPFKGPVLADMLYGDITARDYCDLDVLLSRADVPRAKAVMLAAGYTTDLPADPAMEKAYLRARYEIHFTSPDGTIPIEIHQAFLPPSYNFAFDYDGLWLRLQRRPFFGREILALAPADLLLMLCAHGAKHAWSEPSLVRDLARLVAVLADEISWPEVLQQAQAIGARRMFLLGVFLAANLRSARVPANVLKLAQQDPAVLRLARHVDSGRREDWLFYLQTRERLRDKWACCARLAFTPNEEDYSFLPLPAALSRLYYPLHAVRVAGKYGLGL